MTILLMRKRIHHNTNTTPLAAKSISFFLMCSHSWSTNTPLQRTTNPTAKQLSSHLKQQKLVAPRKWQHKQKGRRAQGQTHKWSEHSHGSLPMNCGPGLCWEGRGLGVPTSLFLAILVLALANSSLKVWGISGSNRTPWDQTERRVSKNVCFLERLERFCKAI